MEIRTEAAWLGHPRHMVFDNSTDFEAKISRVTAAASRIVGLPCRPRKLCKFLLYEPPPPPEEFPVPAKEFRAEKVNGRGFFYEGGGRAYWTSFLPSLLSAPCLRDGAVLVFKGQRNSLVCQRPTRARAWFGGDFGPKYHTRSVRVETRPRAQANFAAVARMYTTFKSPSVPPLCRYGYGMATV